MRKIIAFLFEHVFGATITFLLAGVLIVSISALERSQFFAFVRENEALHDIAVFFLIVFALLLFGVIRFSNDILRWICFRWMLQGPKLCGLFVEAYITLVEDKPIPTIALMVVYYDLRTEQHKISGHAFVRDKTNEVNFVHNASWRSLAFHHILDADAVEIFYVHEGNLKEKTRVRGTTVCHLPLSTTSFRYGFFCDLEEPALKEDITRFPANKFEIVRANDDHARDFMKGIGWPARLKCHCMVGAPPESYFISFVQSKGISLIEDANRQRNPRGGDIMRETWRLLRT